MRVPGQEMKFDGIQFAPETLQYLHVYTSICNHIFHSRVLVPRAISNPTLAIITDGL